MYYVRSSASLWPHPINSRWNVNARTVSVQSFRMSHICSATEVHISGLWKRSKTCRVNGGRPIALDFRVLWVASAGVSHAASHGASHAALYISQHTQTNTHLHTHYQKLPLFVASMHHMWRQDFCFHHCRAYSLEAGRENIEFSNYEPNDFPSTETRIFLQPNSLPWNASYFSREHSNCINLLFSQQIALFSAPFLPKKLSFLW